MGPRLDSNPLVERSRRKTARWWVAHGALREGLVHLHRLLLVPATARRRARRVSALCQHDFARKGAAMRGPPETPNDAVPLFGSWRNAYLAVIGVFIFDVAIFYAISRFFA